MWRLCEHDDATLTLKRTAGRDPDVLLLLDIARSETPGLGCELRFRRSNIQRTQVASSCKSITHGMLFQASRSPRTQPWNLSDPRSSSATSGGRRWPQRTKAGRAPPLDLPDAPSIFTLRGRSRHLHTSTLDSDVQTELPPTTDNWETLGDRR